MNTRFDAAILQRLVSPPRGDLTSQFSKVGLDGDRVKAAHSDQ
jgi:hypothetical protein